ncbi:deoxyribonuclease II [Dictyocaulus viviparus]|uniref:Deoxyribonuclease II n=1 Tax=Dictyocaulus viviparus TaxID=29172 RepID=A0A0D8Y053_DICVI|nr:deoxyribonuclease II [Dictyocaulus viviparus]
MAEIMTSSLLYVAIITAIAIVCNEAKISCKNMKGENVDWYSAIKLPASADETYKGRSFVYIDPSETNWLTSRRPIDDPLSAIGSTVQQLYDTKKETTLKITYNDKCFDREGDSGRAHSKGVVVFDNETGFWLIHSVPNFPPKKSNDPYLVDVTKKHRYKGANATIMEIRTVQNKPFKLFVKSKKFAKDIWQDLIATYYGADFFVETWLNGGATDVETKCNNRRKVYNVEEVKLLSTKFSSSLDHSKWGVSATKNINVVCVGDVNRQESQFKRGGGAACTVDDKLTKTFNNSVASYIGCSIKNKKIGED